MTYLPSIIAGIVGFLVTAILGFWVIPLLRKLKFGQTILEIGPRWHKDKQGTPTIGGVLFVVGTIVATVTGLSVLQVNLSRNLLSTNATEIPILVLGLGMAFAFAAVGFIDDYVKVAKKQNEGLTERQKLVFQFLIAILYLVGLSAFGGVSTIVEIPFLGQLNLGFFYYPIMVLGIIYIVNAVNFTDGVDGLCASVTLIVSIAFLVIAGILQYSGMQLLAAALAGSCLGFLVWNIHPAKVFMGDTGSFFLGGMVIALAFGLGIPVFIVLLGMIYVLEGITVIIQRYYFKYTRKKYGEGKRFFKMAPIHHHFEMSGWPENKIVIAFSMVQAIFCLLAILAVIRMF